MQNNSSKQFVVISFIDALISRNFCVKMVRVIMSEKSRNSKSVTAKTQTHNFFLSKQSIKVDPNFLGYNLKLTSNSQFVHSVNCHFCCLPGQFSSWGQNSHFQFTPSSKITLYSLKRHHREARSTCRKTWTKTQRKEDNDDSSSSVNLWSATKCEALKSTFTTTSVFEALRRQKSMEADSSTSIPTKRRLLLMMMMVFVLRRTTNYLLIVTINRITDGSSEVSLTNVPFRFFLKETWNLLLETCH